MIKRLMLNKLKYLLKYNPAVALLGPRQVGKTTLAKQLKNAYKTGSVYLDLESSRDLRKLDDAESFFEINKDKLVIIDEVQVLPRLFSELRPSIDSKRKSGRFLLLGSASPVLVRGVSESLAGRIAYTELAPLHLSEVAPYSIEQNTLWVRGGFPKSLLSKKSSVSSEWRQSFINSYVQSELSNIFHVELTSFTIRNFWNMLAHYHGNIWNAQTFSNSLGVSAPTVKKYLDYLEGAFLVSRLNPWFINIRKRLSKSPKIYIRDSGILHSLLYIENINDLLGNPVAGHSWEGFVIEQIKELLPVGINSFYYRTHHGAEADLVLVKGIKPIIAAEIKLSNAPVISKGFYESIKDLKTKYNFVITPGSDDYIAKENILVCSLNSFLTKHLKKCSDYND